jgi:site-specific DNA-methyltransferase (adenine-specific)
MIHIGDCLDVMKTLDAESIDAIVTDPPYGLSFMGKDWDHGIPGESFWREALRVAKPGTHLLAFGGTRTFHRLTVAIEDAGWEIRDCIMWVYGSGFPKSHNLDGDWQGWGTALKPAWEPIIVARKPLAGTVAQNVQAYGTGAVNVDWCRIGLETIKVNGWKCGGEQVYNGRQSSGFDGGTHAGRWPANLIHDGSDEVVGLIGEAARFFYCSKASKADRDSGLDGWESRANGIGDERPSGQSMQRLDGRDTRLTRNHHPTVKPNDLMRYLCRLVTPPGGTVLDPFCGSGSTGKAAVMEGFRFIGIELNPEYAAIAEARIQAERDKTALLEAVR